MPTEVIGLIDLSVPPQSVPGIYQILSLLLLPTSTQRRVCVCVCVCVCACVCTYVHTHTSSQEKKMNEALGMK